MFLTFFLISLIIATAAGSQCGQRPEQYASRIVGGSQAGELEWPWQAFLKIYKQSSDTKKKGKCGGTLIDDQWVVSASHCLYQEKNDDLLISVKVVLGSIDKNKEEEYEQEIEVEPDHVFVHPRFGDGLKDDIAMVKLSKKIDFSKTKISPICLPESLDETDNEECMASGWGRTVEGGEDSDVLKEVQMPILDDSKCSSSTNLTAFLCAFNAVGQNTCKGDSGGPLQCPDKSTSNRWVLQGVVSHGVGDDCAGENEKYFTRVVSYVNWINDVRDGKVKSFAELYPDRMSS